MKRTIFFMAILLTAVSFFSCNEKKGLKTIGYVQIAQDPSLDYAKNGFLKALKDSGYVDGENIKILDNNAQGDLSMIPTIIQNFISQNVDIIVTNATPCMMSASQLVKEIPVVFTVAFSPVDMGISPVPDNLYGTYDPYDVKSFADLILSLKPGLKKIGLPYNNTERNAEYSAKKMISEFSSRGIEVVTTSVTSPNDIQTAGNYLCDKNVEAIVVAADNVVNLGQGLLGKICNEKGIPLIASEPMNAEKGAAIGYGVNYTSWGYQSGLKAIDLLRGNVIPAEEKIEPLKDLMLLVNKTVLKKQNLVIPDSILKKAYKIIE
jgi:putative ABC transport system substrate-binding protein